MRTFKSANYQKKNKGKVVVLQNIKCTVA